MANKVTTLVDAADGTTQLYPRTKFSAISDDNGNSLGEVATYNSDTVASGVHAVKFAGLQVDLLWTNPNSLTTAFPAQTVSLNLSDYSVIAIESCHGIDWPNKPSALTFGIVDIGKEIRICSFNDNDRYILMRNASITSTGIAFSTGVQNESSATSNNWVIPYRIYGLRIGD